MPSESTALRGYRFGVFEVDLASAAVRREGLQVRLRGKPFDILVALLERSGEVVTREELRQRLWASDTFVDFDHGMNAAMNRLRDAIGDAAENPRFIQTIPKRGYRFIAPVERLGLPVPVEPVLVQQAPDLRSGIAEALAADAHTTSAPVPSRSPRRWIAAAVVVTLSIALAFAWAVRSRNADPAAAGSAGRRMIAVLPFENLSGDPEQDYFSQGITEELIGQLGSLNPEQLGVIARTTVARYRTEKQSINEIGRALGVQYVLEGSVRRSESRVRITAQLIEVGRQTQLWTDSYDHEVGDVLLTQRDVAMQVAGALTMSVLATRTVPRMPSPAAYEAYLRGRFLRQQATNTSLTRAREYFEQAIALDPSYAPAYAGVADVFHVLGGPGWEFAPARELLPRALEAAERAIALDPQVADGYAVRGMSRLWLDWNAGAAEQDLRRAIGLNPSFAQAHQYLSTVLTVQGRFEEAVDAAARAAHLDPLSPIAGTTLGYRYYYARRYEEALREFDRAQEIAPEFVSAHLGQAQVYRATGRTADSLAAITRVVPFAGGRTLVQAHLAYAQAAAGNGDGARQTRASLVAQSRSRYVSPFDLALASAALDDRAAVVSYLDRAFADRSGWMMFVPLEGEFARYRDDVAALAARVKASAR
jgi:TolB-like protein/DNA-binding winged helix-turn-helix (wHTH) protein/Flp pilus assembly protein TadD